MKLLLDTHVLIWSTYIPERLPVTIREQLEDFGNDLYFSVVSLWEIGVKRNLQRPDFVYDPHLLRRVLLRDGFHELPVTADHALAIDQLPDVHRDPFDRLLLCQARVEGLTIATDDKLLTQYPVAILRV